MRTWIIGAAAILAVAVPSVAAAQTGYVGALYSNTDVDGGDEADAWGVEGAVAFSGSSSISFEVDAAVVDGDDDTAYGLTGHVFTRNDSHLFGGFVGLTDSDNADTTWFAGLEGALYYTDWTLAGTVAYGNNDDSNADAWGVNAEARYFINDNFRLNGNLGWANIDASMGDDDAFSYGLGGEYQFDAAPISVGLGWSHTSFDESDFDADTVTAGVRYNWGGTLRDRDRSGASQANVLGGFGSAFVL